MTALRRFALGFPVTWSHRRACSFDAVADPGNAPYFISWDPGSGVYGEDWTVAPFDERGVLLSGPRKDYHPIRIAQFALHRFGIWAASGDIASRDDFLAQATWLRDNQARGAVEGLYRFEFPWAKYGAAPGWSSAMAQGESISVLLRAQNLDPEKGYGDAASRAAIPFRSDIAHGGVVWRSGDDVFFEEIANEHAAHVLNGCIYALWGLWELWSREREAWQAALVDECVDTLARWLPSFDTGWWTLYSLLQTSTGGRHVATLKYHAFHIAQMRVLARMFEKRVFEEAAGHWSEYIERRECRARLFGATLRSVPERFLGRDTIAGGART